MANNDSFRASMAKRIAKSKAKTELFYKKLAMEVMKRVIEKSPVQTGRFRANWFVGYGTADTSTSENTDVNGKQTVTANAAVITGLKVDGKTIWITNSLPYASVLEYGKFGTGDYATERSTRDGYSVQAPYGMVRVTLAELSGVARQIATEVKRS